MIRWAVFVSGQGTNLQNVLELERDRLKSSEIALIVSDRECPALKRAEQFKKAFVVLDPKAPHADATLIKTLKDHRISAIFLLGYMRILRLTFLKAWQGQLVNLHPSLLPKYKGANAIQKAFEANEKTLGVTLHEVVEEVDSGRILRQIEFARDPLWSLDEAVEAVHAHERKIVAEYLLDLEENVSIRQNTPE